MILINVFHEKLYCLLATVLYQLVSHTILQVACLNSFLLFPTEELLTLSLIGTPQICHSLCYNLLDFLLTTAIIDYINCNKSLELPSSSQCKHVPQPLFFDTISIVFSQTVVSSSDFLEQTQSFGNPPPNVDHRLHFP